MFSNQFLSRYRAEVESKRLITGSYQVAGSGSGTATKMHVAPASCTAKKVLCI